MSNAARRPIPGSSDTGKGELYDFATDAFVLTDLATQAEVAAFALTGALAGSTLSNPQIAAGVVGGTELANASVTAAKISATGTPSSTTFHRGDNVWAVPPGGGGGSSETLVDHATPTGTTETLDLSTGNVHRVRWDANVTFTFSNATSGWSSFKLLFYHETSSTNYTVTWPASVKWDGGLNPFLANSNVADGVATFEFWSHNGGTTWYGHHGGTFNV